MLPSSFTHRSAAAFKLSNYRHANQKLVVAVCRSLLTLRTSTAPIPRTLAPGRTSAISFAAFSVFSTLRPTMQAFAPRRTRARVWPLPIEPAPPVMNRTRFAAFGRRYQSSSRESERTCLGRFREYTPKIPSAHTALKYSDRGTVMMLGVEVGSRCLLSNEHVKVSNGVVEG